MVCGGSSKLHCQKTADIEAMELGYYEWLATVILPKRKIKNGQSYAAHIIMQTILKSEEGFGKNPRPLIPFLLPNNPVSAMAIFTPYFNISNKKFVIVYIVNRYTMARPVH